MSPSTIDRFTTLVVGLLMSSCRFGGPSGDATLPVDPTGNVAGTGGQAGSGGEAGNVGNGGTSGGAGGSLGGGAGSSVGGAGLSVGGAGSSVGGAAGANQDASDDIAYDAVPDANSDRNGVGLDVGTDVAFDGEFGDGEPPTACLPAFSSAVCDPVCNSGCPSLFRCDVTDTSRTGICVGTLLSPATEGMACSRTLATDDCVERLTCVESTCKRLCYRDTDCTTNGTCCNGAIDVDGGPSGYRLCVPCMP